MWSRANVCARGKKGIIEKQHDARKEWQRVVEDGQFDAQGSQAVDCGHYIPEEQPEELVKQILDFMKEQKPDMGGRL